MKCMCPGSQPSGSYSSTVRSLADESFGVLVVEDCCAAATEELHLNELKTINMIYCHVVQSEDVLEFLD